MRRDTNKHARRWLLGDLTVREPGPADHDARWLPPFARSALAGRDRVVYWYPQSDYQLVALTAAGSVLLITQQADGSASIEPMRAMPRWRSRAEEPR